MYTPYYRQMLDETVRRERQAFEAHYPGDNAGRERDNAEAPRGKDVADGKARAPRKAAKDK